MQTFLQKLSLALLFTGVLLGGLELYARANDDSSQRKQRDYFDEHYAKLKGLIFGPSHLLRSVDPLQLDMLTVSFAQQGNPFNLDYLLIDKALEKSHPDFILLDFSLGRPEHILTDNLRKKRMFYYFGVRIAPPKLKDFFLLRHPVYRFLAKRPKGKRNAAGFEYELPPPDQNAKKRAAVLKDTSLIHGNETVNRVLEKHQQLDSMNREQNFSMLLTLIDRCKAAGIRLIFISPPKFFLYNQLINPTHRTVRAEFLAKVVDDQHVYFWDYETFGDHESDYFYNLNHMSPAGATAFTAELNRRLRSLD